MATASQVSPTTTISYDLPISPFGTVVHTLGHPLTEIRDITRRRRYDWWAEDEVNREIVFTGDGVNEIEATIRFENEPSDLKQLLRLALQYNLTLTYTQSSVSYPVKLVAVLGASGSDETPLEPDRDRYGFGEWECRVRLRRVDGGSLAGIFEQS